MALGGAFRIWQFLSILKHRVQARTAANFKLRIALLLAFSVANVVLGGLVYGWIAPEEGWSTSLFTVYAVLFSIPGADITHAPTPLATCLLNIIFIFGLLVFATILAMISDEVQNLLLAARSGRSPLVMKDHLLIVNWNKQVPFILDQLEQVQKHYSSSTTAAAAAGSSSGWQRKPYAAGRHPFAGRPVVILADEDKEAMDKLVISFMRQHQLEVHTRTGKPYVLDHLRRVSASAAAAVLVLHPESDTAAAAGSSALDTGGAAALKMQTILALSSMLRGKKAAVVVQVPESSPDPSAAAATATAAVASSLPHLGGSSSSVSTGCCSLSVLDQVLNATGHSIHLLELPVRRIINSLAVQTSLQAGVASTYHQLLQQGVGPDINFIHLPPQLFDQKMTTVKVAQQTMHIQPGSSSSSSSSSSSKRNEAYSSSFLGSFSVGGLFKRRRLGTTPAAAAAGGTSGSEVTQAPVAAVTAATLAAAAPETASAVAAVAAAAAGGSVAYGDVSVRYSADLLVVGFCRAAEHQLVLNPDDDVRLGPGDVLVAMTKPRGRRKLLAPLWRPLCDLSSHLATLLLRHMYGSGTCSGSGTGSSSSNSSALQQRHDSSVTVLHTQQQQDQVQSLRLMSQTRQKNKEGALTAAVDDVDDVDDHDHDLNRPLCNNQTSDLLINSSSTMSDIAAVAAAAASEAAYQHMQSAAGGSSSNASDTQCNHNASSSRGILGFNARRRYNASKVVQQRNRALAAHRLDRTRWKSSGETAAAAVAAVQPPQQQQSLSSSKPQHVLVVGFTATEAAEELLPHFLDFALPGSHVTIVMAAAAAAGDDDGSSSSNSSFAALPGGLQAEGVLEDVEERRNRTSVVHKITYRFVSVMNPTTCEGLAAAGLLGADAVLLAAAAAPGGSSSSSPAEADARVLGMMVEIQHLLTLNAAAGDVQSNSQNDSVSGMQSNSDADKGNRPWLHHTTSFADRAAQLKQASMKRRSIVSKIAAEVADDTALHSSDKDCLSQNEQGAICEQAAAAAYFVQGQQQGGGQRHRLHVVACVHSTATKAVAEAFFGGSGPCSPCVNSSSRRLRNHCCLFSYELIVPGQVEAAVLVQVAHQPMYSKVVLEMLGSSDGCELYLLDPASCGFNPGEVVTFGEVQEVGRLLHKTVIGVIAQGQVVLAPGGDWKWVVRETDRVAAIALSW